MLRRPCFCSLSLPPTNWLENKQIFFLCSSISQRFVLQVGTENLLLVGREQREECCGEAELNMGFLLTLSLSWCVLLCASWAVLCSRAFQAGACWGRGIFRSQMDTVGKQSEQSIQELGESTGMILYQGDCSGKGAVPGCANRHCPDLKAAFVA